MISSGMRILRAMYVLEAQTENKFLKETIVAVRRDVEAGLALSDAMERHPKVFNPLFVAMTRAGEAGGLLESALLRVADQLEREASLRRQVKSAMVYPTLVLVFALVVMIALVAFLVPVFVSVFKEFGGELPAITKFSVKTSAPVHPRLVGDVRGRRRRRRRVPEMEEELLGPPPVGPLPAAHPDEDRHHRAGGRRRALVAHALLADQRRRAPAARPRDHRQDRRQHRRRRGHGIVIDSVKRGGTISAPLAQILVFPTMVTHMVGVGEETGALDTMLGKIADFYEDRVDAAVKASPRSSSPS